MKLVIQDRQSGLEIVLACSLLGRRDQARRQQQDETQPLPYFPLHVSLIDSYFIIDLSTGHNLTTGASILTGFQIDQISRFIAVI